jgi:predicted DNA-binding transcriptional regulator AlpA
MTTYLDIWELSELLGRAPETIRKQLRSDPQRIPPRMHIPGTRMLRWKASEVEAWLEEQKALFEVLR